MRTSRFTDEQIIGIVREYEAGAKLDGALPAAQRLADDLLQVAGEVRRDGGLGRQAAAGARGGEPPPEAAPGRHDARQPGAQGAAGKKLVTPAARRQAVAIAQEEHGLSRRRACRLIGIARSVVEREPKRARDHARLRERLRALAGERRRFGYRRLHELLRREGWKANHKLVERLYREEKLAIRRRGRQKRGLGGMLAGSGARSPPTSAGPRLHRGLPGQRPPVPHRQSQGRLHARVPGDPGRLLAAGPAGGRHARGCRPRARLSGHAGRRQRSRAARSRPRPVGARARRAGCSSSIPASRCRTARSRASTAGSARNASTRAGSRALPRPGVSSRLGGSTTIEHRPHTSLRMRTPAAFAAARPFAKRQRPPRPTPEAAPSPDAVAALSPPVLSGSSRIPLMPGPTKGAGSETLSSCFAIDFRL